MPDPNPYGPDKPCRRTACVAAARFVEQDSQARAIEAGDDPADVLADPLPDVGDHLGGAHLDPTDREHYDGPVTLVRALPYAVRDAFRPLMSLVGCYTDRHYEDDTKVDTPLRAAADLAIDAAGREIERLRQQVAHVQVNADRQVREAMARAADCAEHGKDITDLEKQVGHRAAHCERVERARLALLGEHQAVRDILDAMEDASRRAVVTVGALVEALRRINKRASAAHDRAFRGK